MRVKDLQPFERFAYRRARKVQKLAGQLAELILEKGQRPEPAGLAGWEYKVSLRDGLGEALGEVETIIHSVVCGPREEDWKENCGQCPCCIRMAKAG